MQQFGILGSIHAQTQVLAFFHEFPVFSASSFNPPEYIYGEFENCSIDSFQIVRFSCRAFSDKIETVLHQEISSKLRIWRRKRLSKKIPMSNRRYFGSLHSWTRTYKSVWLVLTVIFQYLQYLAFALLKLDSTKSRSTKIEQKDQYTYQNDIFRRTSIESTRKHMFNCY